MKKLTTVLLVFLLTISLVLAGCSSNAGQPAAEGGNDAEQKDMPKFMKIVAATSGGTFFLLANAMSQLFNEEIPGMKASAQSTPGAPKIIETLHTGQGEIGFSQAGVADDAFHGRGQFEGKPMDNIRGLTYLYPNVMQLVVHKGSGLQTVPDLKGNKVAVGAAGGASEINSYDLFKAYDIDYRDKKEITPEYVTEAQTVDLLKNKQVSGANLISPIGSAAMIDLMTNGEYEILPIPQEIVEQLQQVNGAYFPYTIPANTYPNQPEAIETYAVANWLIARGDVSEDFTYEVLKVLYDNLDVMVSAHAVASDIKLENALNGQTIPLHPGAIKFYKENGIEIKE